MKILYKSKVHRGRKRATTKRTDADAIKIKSPQREDMGPITRANAEAIQIEGPLRQEKGDNKENGCRGYTNQGPAEGGEGRQ